MNIIKSANLVYLLLLVGLSAAVQIGVQVCPRSASNTAGDVRSSSGIEASPRGVSAGSKADNCERCRVSKPVAGRSAEGSYTTVMLRLLGRLF